MQTILLSFVKGLVTSFLTERFVLNLLVLLADWASKKTDTDVDDQFVEHLKRYVDSRFGKEKFNLYEEIKKKTGLGG